MNDVFASCITWPFSENVIASFCGSATNSLGVMKGPSGANVSWFLLITQSEPYRVSPRPPRSDTSFWIVYPKI